METLTVAQLLLLRRRLIDLRRSVCEEFTDAASKGNKARMIYLTALSHELLRDVGHCEQRARILLGGNGVMLS